ncbi:MAG: SoxR reducing system RseC family protein [Candidatus Omnitrophota bacterium]
MKEKAVVISTKEREALVRTVPNEKCSGCCSCGASKSRSFIVPLGGMSSPKEGDILEIEVNPSSMIGVYLILYAIPLLVFVLALIGAYAVTASPLLSFALASSVLGAVYLAIGYIVRRSPALLPAVCVKKTDDIEL